MNQRESFSIRQMIELTGLSEFTIRGWENRYAAFEPLRTETGRREYLKPDIERALLLRELLKRGHKIGQIATLSQSKLKSLLEADETCAREVHVILDTIARTFELLAVQKWAELESLFAKQKFKSASQFVHQFFMPLMRRLSERVREGHVSVAQEHFLSALLKEKIYAELTVLSQKRRRRVRSPRVRFVLATPEGDHHELGLLIAHLLIRSFDGASLYLGPHTPPNEIAETSLRFNASHILIVSTVSKRGGAAQDTLKFLSEIRRRVGPQVTFLVAGQQAPVLAPVDTGIIALRDFQSLEKILNKGD